MCKNPLKHSSELFEIILNAYERQKRISWPPLQLSGIRANDNTQKQGVVYKIAPCFKFFVWNEFTIPKTTVTILLGPFINLMSKGENNISGKKLCWSIREIFTAVLKGQDSKASYSPSITQWNTDMWVFTPGPLPLG